MKKIITIFLSLMILLNLFACGNKSDTQSTSDTTTAETTIPTLTKEELIEATQYIKKSENAIAQAAAYQANNWTTTGEVMYYYFDDNEYWDAYLWKQHYDTIKSITKLRVQARNDMASAKEILSKGGSGEHYSAVKEYYTTVNTFLNLISEFPSGHSKLTFTQAISQNQTSCSTAYSNVDFYQ